MSKVTSAHRNNDLRYCLAITTVKLQSTVRVEGELWAVLAEDCDHGLGLLKADYGNQKVRVEGQPVIVVGCTAYGDNEFHPVPPTDPETGSGTVFAYTGTTGAGS